MPMNKALDILNHNGVVAFPTETVYGLGARIDSDEALKKIFSTKERPFFDPLIVHVDSVENAKKCYSQWNEVAECLAKNFWPGPLTLVMEKSHIISDVITSGLPSVGVRIPNHPVALELLQKIKVPVAAPSANKFGKTSPTSAEHVRKEFGDAVYVLESSVPCQIGIESTVLLVRNNLEISILRRGIIVKSEIEKVLNENKVSYKWTETIDKKESPGHMKHHYMPPVPFILCTDLKKSVEDLKQIIQTKMSELPDKIEEVSIVKPKGAIQKIAVMNLSEDPLLAARGFYNELRVLAAQKPDCIVLYKQPSHSSERWESLYDRINKAASLVIS